MEQAKTREEYKRLKTESMKQVAAERPGKRKRRRLPTRLIPIWLRLVLLIVFSFVFMTAGAAVGYGKIGNGNPGDVFKMSTWTHIHDLIYKK
jgi:lipopolysaccharide/colanic/teichoic acid biosynthesis glycosyltransferase